MAAAKPLPTQPGGVERGEWVAPREPSEPAQSARRGQGTIVNIVRYVPDTATAFNPIAAPSTPTAPRVPLALPVRAR